MTTDGPPRDRHFDGWRAPRGPAAWDLVHDIAGQLQTYEAHFQKRQRARKPADQRTFEATVAAVACNLAHVHLTDPDRALAVPRSNRQLGRRCRYRSPAENKTLPYLLDLLASPELDMLVQHLGARHPFGGINRQTTIRPSERFIRKLGEFGVELEDIGRSPDEEVIILRSVKEDWDDGGTWLPYADTPDTIRWRDEVRAINRWLDAADLAFDHAACGCDQVIDTGNRQLKRRFTNGNFGSGGRLYGGFWMTMKTAVRHDGIRIDGQPITEFDYAQMALRMLYGLAGKVPPEGDLYALSGVDSGSREGVKKLVNAMLSTTKTLSRKPKDTAEFLRGQTVRDWMEAVKRAHPDIRDQFNRGVGHRLQHMESEVLIALLLRLNAEKITALPMHDGVIVRKDAGPRTQVVMEEVFRDRFGMSAVVREESTSSASNNGEHLAEVFDDAGVGEDRRRPPTFDLPVKHRLYPVYPQPA